MFKNMLLLIFGPSRLEEISLVENSETRPEAIREVIKSKREGWKTALPRILVPDGMGHLLAWIMLHLSWVDPSCAAHFGEAAMLIFAFATLSRLRDRSTFDGTTLPETTNKFLFQCLYGLGLFLLVTAHSLA
jgi:hypothetical protein